MNWLVTIFAGLLGSLTAGAGIIAIASLWVKWFRISSFEGASSYFVVGLGLLGAVVGFILSIIVARVAHAQIGLQWYIQIGTAFAAVAASLLLVLAISCLNVDLTPDSGGQGIVVVWEIRLPEEVGIAFPGKADPGEWTDEELRLQLVSVVSGKSGEAVFDREAFHLDDGQWILPARVSLFTSKGELCVNLSLAGLSDGFWPPVMPTPSPSYFQWSAWSRTNNSNETPDDSSAVMYRFKFEKQPAQETNR
jgi:hypothetical protein